MKWFKNVITVEELRKEYRRLLKLYHPDNENGSVEVTQEINAEYDRLKEYSWLSIDQNVKNKNLFRVVCRGKDTKSLEMIMETKEREKFELYLISNPLIKATEELFGSFA